MLYGKNIHSMTTHLSLSAREGSLKISLWVFLISSTFFFTSSTFPLISSATSRKAAMPSAPTLSFPFSGLISISTSSPGVQWGEAVCISFSRSLTTILVEEISFSPRPPLCSETHQLVLVCCCKVKSHLCRRSADHIISLLSAEHCTSLQLHHVYSSVTTPSHNCWICSIKYFQHQLNTTIRWQIHYTTKKILSHSLLWLWFWGSEPNRRKLRFLCLFHFLSFLLTIWCFTLERHPRVNPEKICMLTEFLLCLLLHLPWRDSSQFLAHVSLISFLICASSSSSFFFWASRDTC